MLLLVVDVCGAMDWFWVPVSILRLESGALDLDVKLTDGHSFGAISYQV